MIHVILSINFYMTQGSADWKSVFASVTRNVTQGSANEKLCLWRQIATHY